MLASRIIPLLTVLLGCSANAQPHDPGTVKGEGGPGDATLSSQAGHTESGTAGLQGYGPEDTVEIIVNTKTDILLRGQDCLEGLHFEAHAEVPSDPSLRQPVPHFAWELVKESDSAQCAKLLNVKSFWLPRPVKVRLVVEGQDDSGQQKTRLSTLVEAKLGVPSQQPEAGPETGPAQPRDPKWDQEPAADVDCNGTPCTDAIDKFLKRATISDGSTALSVVKNQRTTAIGSVKFSLAPGSGPAHGTFSLDAFEVPVTAGDFAVRNGFLALRSPDGRDQLYFRWYPVNQVPELFLDDTFSTKYGKLSLRTCCMPVSTE